MLFGIYKQHQIQFSMKSHNLLPTKHINPAPDPSASTALGTVQLANMIGSPKKI